jgi:hypothetical protein
MQDNTVIPWFKTFFSKKCLRLEHVKTDIFRSFLLYQMSILTDSFGVSHVEFQIKKFALSVKRPTSKADSAQVYF